MKLRRRIISTALSLVLALSLLPAAAFAADATYTETIIFTTNSAEGTVAFYNAYTSDADTEIIFAGGTSDSGVSTQALDTGDGVVPEGRTKYIHTDFDQDESKTVTGTYTYYLNNDGSTVIWEYLRTANATFQVIKGTLTLKNGQLGAVTVDGSNAVLNLEDGAIIAASKALTHTSGTINLSGAVTVTRWTYNGVPMTITDSIDGSSIQLYKWGTAVNDYETSGKNYVLAKAADGYTLTNADLAAFKISSSKKISDYSFYVEDNQVIYGKGHTHTYGDPEITWTVDEDTGDVSAALTATCTGLDDTKPLGECTVTQTDTVAATCTENSGTVYTASITYEGVDYTDTYIVYSTEDDATGHSYVYAGPEWAEDYSSCTVVVTCANENCDYEETVICTDVSSVTTDPTCTEDGYTTYTATGTLEDGTVYTSDAKVVTDEGSKTGHSYVYADLEWSEDYSSCTVAVTCKNCDHAETVDCTVTPVITDPTCTENGYTTYTATGTLEDGITVYTSEPVVVTDEGSAGHTENEAVVENEVAATCTEDGSYDSVVYCAVCGEELSRETITVSATGHTESEAVVENEVAATCTETGSYDSVVYCAVCDAELSRETITVSATGHTENEAVVENEVAATCTEDGSYDSVVYCAVCGEELSRETITVSASATGHIESEAVVENEVTATCTEAGSYDSVVYCAVCGAELSRETTTIPATGHNYEGSAVKTEPTCTEDGSYVITVACTECDNELYTYTYAIPATGHTWDEGTEIVAATRYTRGEKVFTCTVCGKTKTEYTNKVNATFLFDDVQDDSRYYFIPVYWAYDLGITDGTSATLFSPSQGCTRAQFVTFLYRLAQANGVDTSTGDTSSSFTDVSSSKYYYKAVLWAAENGITVGTNTAGTLFSPDVTITRAQAVTMLYRYETMVAGEPEVTTDNPFSDVSENSYYTAILWAYENGVTDGTTAPTVDSDGVVTAKGVFSPNATCTRAQMVTFLYNYAAIQDD